jgi:hypothetical protein
MEEIHFEQNYFRIFKLSEEKLEDETSKFINYGQSTSTKYLALQKDELRVYPI